MSISPISAGITPTYSVNATAAPTVAAPKAVEDAAPASSGDQVALGEETAPKKKGFFSWLKDLVKTEVDGPAEPYIDRTCRRLEDIMKDAQPEDIPSSMPDHSSKGSEPTEFYIPGCGSHTGLSVSVPDSSAPTMADVSDYHTISLRDAVTDFHNRGNSEKLSTMEKAVIKEYCGQSFMAMNGHLLDGEDNAAGTVDKAVRVAAGALEKCDAPQGIVLNRCASLSELLNYVGKDDYAKYKKFDSKGKTEQLAKILNERLTGTQTTRKTFISTSAGSEIDFMTHPKVLTKFYVGEGVKGAFVSADADLVQFNGENEFLLAPNMKTSVMGVEYDPENKGLVMHVFVGDKPEV